MSQTQKPKRKPTHTIFHVRGEGEKAFWNRVGAAWIHEDGEGLSLALDYLPLGDNVRLTVRVNKPDEGQSQTGAGAQ